MWHTGIDCIPVSGRYVDRGLQLGALSPQQIWLLPLGICRVSKTTCLSACYETCDILPHPHVTSNEPPRLGKLKNLHVRDFIPPCWPRIRGMDINNEVTWWQWAVEGTRQQLVLRTDSRRVVPPEQQSINVFRTLQQGASVGPRAQGRFLAAERFRVLNRPE